MIYDKIDDALDLHIFGVFDGHGGTYAAEFISIHLPLIIKSEIEALLEEKATMTMDECNRNIARILEESFLAADDKLLRSKASVEGGTTGKMCIL